jgi:hypothetical protein
MRKEVFGVERWSRYRRERNRHDRVCDWDVGVASVMDLNISRWRGKSIASAGNMLGGHVGLRCGWQFDSDILVPDVWVN